MYKSFFVSFSLFEIFMQAFSLVYKVSFCPYQFKKKEVITPVDMLCKLNVTAPPLADWYHSMAVWNKRL